ncbi:MAG TPA: hypothetical protein VE263_19460 [Candidatus Angelobacter sp.]|nr:hypothetical protein [Candidatus Angelobacter sp.]
MSGNFAIRLRCPVCEMDSWVTLPDRPESADEIRQQTWDFKCRQDGVQRSTPKEVIEMAPLEEAKPSRTQKAPPPVANPITTAETKRVARSSERVSMRVPVVVYGFTQKSGAFHEDSETLTVNSSGALVMLKTKLELGDFVLLMHKSSRMEQEVRVAYLDPYSERETKVGLAFKKPIPDFWRKSRKQARTPKALRVVVHGTDAQGHKFKQSAYTIDLSRDGARLDGVGFLTSPGQTIEVRRLWRKKNFRVVWIGQVGTDESNQIGVFGLQAEKDIWHVPLKEGDPGKPPGDSKSKKK